MKEFKQYITELRTKPADSNAKHDSDHDLVDVSDESVCLLYTSDAADD